MHFYQVMAVVCWLKGNNLRGHSKSTYALKWEGVLKKAYETIQGGGVLQRAYVRSCNFHKVSTYKAS